MSYKRKGKDGRYERIQGYAVLTVGVYRGWEIRKHWGGFVAEKAVNGGRQVVETYAYPYRRQVEKAIDAFEGAARERGIDTNRKIQVRT